MPDERYVKPPYSVPSMDVIRGLPWNGYSVVSTFSGCGGSCLGFKMAGFRVLWANEFIPAAQDTYQANHQGTYLDRRDIRTVQASDIRSVIGDIDIDVLEGSPPCASFSMAGKREKGWGRVKNYSDTKQRVDDLFFEYARLLKDLQPKTFIAENVSGLVKGVSKGYFKEILKTLKACGYQVEARLLDAQWLGVPQLRQRIIFQGIRNGLKASPRFPKPLPYRYSVREALPNIFEVGVHVGGTFTPKFKDASSRPSEAILTPSGNMGYVRAIHDTKGLFSEGDFTDKPCPTILGTPSTASQFQVEREAWIEGHTIGDAWDHLAMGEESEKYINLKRSAPELPSKGISAVGGSSPGTAAVTHPLEKRKFSIAELKRICAFPDDFILTGSYAQQWERLGRSVPPVMMSHVARVLRDEVLLLCVE